MKLQKKERTSNRKRTDIIEFAILALPAVVLVFVFSYLPMGGIVLAFKRFNATQGIFGSPWVGFDNFKFFFVSSDAWRVIRNTLGLNLLFMAVNLVCQIAFAMLCFMITSRKAIKVFQTATIMPSFLSWVVVGYLTYALLKPQGGVINSVITAFGGTGIKWYSEPEYWPVILLLTQLWHGIGNGSLFYFASLMGIDSVYFEAATLDGATRWQQFWYIILPFLKPIIIIRQILAVGGIFNADFGLFYNITRNIGRLYPTTDVINTYVYRSLVEVGNIGMSAAVGFMQSVVGFVLVITTNLIVRKLEPDSALF